MIERLFDDVLGTPPPSTVDVNAIVRRERRRAYAQRVAGLASGGAALALAAVLVPGTLGRQGPTSLPRPPSATAPVAAAGTFRLTAGSERAAAATGESLTRALDQALHRQAPDATWIPNPGATGAASARAGVPPQIRCYAKPGTGVLCVGMGAVAAGNRSGSLSLHIWNLSRTPCSSGAPTSIGGASAACGSDGQLPVLMSCANFAASHCVESTGPQGRPMRTLTHAEASQRGRPAYQEQLVSEVLADGRVLQMDVWNATGPDGTLPKQADTPLSRQQVEAVVNDIASRITR